MDLGWVPVARPRSPAPSPGPWKGSPSRLLSSLARLAAGPAHPNCSRYSRLRCCDTLGGRGPGDRHAGPAAALQHHSAQGGEGPEQVTIAPPRPPAAQIPGQRRGPTPPLGAPSALVTARPGNCGVEFLALPWLGGGGSPITKAHLYTLCDRPLAGKLLRKEM